MWYGLWLLPTELHVIIKEKTACREPASGMITLLVLDSR